MNTLQSTPEQKRLAQILHQKRQRKFEQIAREIEADRRRMEREAGLPTRHRLAKGDITNKSERTGSVAPAIVHQVRDPLDNVRKHLTDDEIASLARFVVNYEHAQRTRAVTANYDGVGGGSFGPRHGGVPDRSREAATIADWMLRQLHEEFRSVAAFIVDATQRDRDGNPLTARDFMGAKFPAMGDKGRRDGGYIALCRSLAWRLQELERDLRNSIRGEAKGGINHVRQIISLMSRARTEAGSR